MMRRMEPTFAVVLTIVLLGLFMAASRPGEAQTTQGRTVSSGTTDRMRRDRRSGPAQTRRQEDSRA